MSLEDIPNEETIVGVLGCCDECCKDDSHLSYHPVLGDVCQACIEDYDHPTHRNTEDYYLEESNHRDWHSDREDFHSDG